MTKWIRKGKYYAERSNDPTTTICWDDKQDSFLLFIKNEPIEAYKTAEEAKENYEKRANT